MRQKIRQRLMRRRAELAEPVEPLADRGVLLIKALPRCTHCEGLGQSGNVRRSVCICVYRRAFRESLELYLLLREDRGGLGAAVPLELSARGSLAYGMPFTEYVVDFDRAAVRVLTRRQLALLTLHYIAGEGWRPCAEKLGLDRGSFFHEAYRTERLMGRALMEAEPPLFPSSRYFEARRLEFGAPKRAGYAAPLMAAA